MIHQTLLRRAVAGRDPALVDFVEALAPAILTHFAAVPALGGSGRAQVLDDPRLPADLPRVPPEALEKFSHKHDQSMATHILNGVFAGMRVAEKLPPDKALNDREKRLWLLGYVVHDYTKVYGIRVAAGDLPVIRQVIASLGETLNFDGFLVEWQEYLDDIAFLAQNTQTVEGANLSVREFTGLKTHPRRLEVLRLLSSFADVLVHITSPSDVAERGADDRDRATNLSTKLKILFGAEQAPRLAYHRLTEVRGLISNLINNAMMQSLQAQGYEPFLFFPNGVVYLAAPGVEAQTNADTLAETVWAQIVDIVSNSENFGVRRAGTGFIPSSALYELTGLSGVLDAGRRKAMRIAISHATPRLYGFFTGESVNDVLKRVGDPVQVEQLQTDLVRSKELLDDVRVDRLGEYLTFVYRTVRDTFKKAPDVAPLLLSVLGLKPEISAEEATRQKGGTYFGWFYAAARYVQAHSGIDDSQIDECMMDLAERVQFWIEEQGIEGRAANSIGDSVKDYIVSRVEVSGQHRVEGGHLKFAEELGCYTENKSRRRPVCSLCSSSYDGVPQETTEIPFINQQYSNKNPLAGTTVIRGVCPVCRIEMILRRVQQPGLDEGNKPVQLYLYPTYFFTSETALVVKTYLNELEDMNIFGLINHLRKNGFTAANLVTYEGLERGDEEGHSYTILRPHYSEHAAAGLFSFALRPLGKKPTDTDAWVLPTLYGLALPLLLNVKVVITPSFAPVFGTGADFRETTVLDAPHGFTRHILGRDRFRVDETGDYLIRLLQLYDLHLDVFAEPKDLHWPQINAVAKDVATDPLHVFAYYDRKARSKKKDKGKKGGNEPKGIPDWDVQRYVEIYQALGGEANMGFIGEIVDAYAQFYQAEFGKLDSAHAVLRPLMTALDVTIESDPQTDGDDLSLLVAGAVNDDQERVRGGQADGFDPIATNKEIGSYPERIALSRQKIEEFARLFLDEVFNSYCYGDRAILRERTNRIRSAARFYYLQHYGRKAKS
ncbi:MAG: type I-D CRISPR-associated protein Cas10d/Csc3 [Chloroflexota bacterium]